ncbi:ImmA/IrrE family metallo-endopeptidase [Bacillus sp. Xin]|uniref:ImmA/IrrE family metallo-endopeptidase n=1 Tax=unclassified Bacillus (in: firmicutes) TaxID=185979 RepID=UPI001573BB28|nr:MULTISPECIES: ImmA/IrrE family metallo-endopeptidase [unclassified Bacillus (in: firmicutes)]MBC6971941.1 ImmA/IrrE family metallo-endopeptidase [Bacillus sp. Xin]NSW37544.1 ImmA/IrrE family metallo-endopeptidase [Bacillus sp. Xin1]
MHKTQPYYTTQIEDYIKNLYHSLSIFIPEQIDMITITQKLNIWLHFAPFGSRAICRNNLPSIIIDNRNMAYQQWEDFGHELCHILFHVGNQLYIPKLFLDYQGAKANNFKLHFCIPTFMLRTLTLPETRKESIYLIAKTFNVSFHTAEQRLLHYENQLLASHLQNVFSQTYLIMQ